MRLLRFMLQEYVHFNSTSLKSRFSVADVARVDLLVSSKPANLIKKKVTIYLASSELHFSMIYFPCFIACFYYFNVAEIIV